VKGKTEEKPTQVRNSKVARNRSADAHGEASFLFPDSSCSL